MAGSKRTYEELEQRKTQEEKERDILNEIFHTWGQHLIYITKEKKEKQNEIRDI